MTSQDISEQAFTLLEEAQDHARHKQWEEAYQCAKQASEIHPNWVDPYGNLAWFYVCSSRYDDAISMYQKVLELDPQNTEAALRAGYLCEVFLDFPQALKFYKQAKHDKAKEIQQKINTRKTYSFLRLVYKPLFYGCVILRSLRLHNRALWLLTFISSLQPKSRRPYYLLAKLHTEIHSHDIEDSLQFAAALLIRGTQYRSSAAHYALLTTLMCRFGDYPAAVEYGQDALSYKENELQTIQNLAEAYCQLERYDDALKTYETLSKLEPQNPIHLLHRAVILQNDRKYTVAEALYMQALTHQPKSILTDFLHQTLLYEKTVNEYHSQQTHLMEYSHYDYDHPQYKPPFRIVDQLLKLRRKLNNFGYGTVPQWFIKNDYKRIGCAVCGSQDHKYLTTCTKNGWRIVRCSNCDLVYTRPQPTAEVLYGKYQGEYWQTERNTGAEQFHEAAKQENCIQPLDDKLFQWLEIEGIQEWEQSLGPERNILDVGCGLGIFMREMQNRNWNVQGTEVAGYAVEFCQQQGFTIHPGTLDTLHNQTYDFITLHHVIEHVNEPHVLMKLAAGLLNPGGKVLVRTPCCDSIPAYVAGKDWFYDPDHIYFFNQKSLCKLLENAGFEIQSVVTYIGVEQETWQESWYGLKLNHLISQKVEDYNQGDVICVLASKKE